MRLTPPDADARSCRCRVRRLDQRHVRGRRVAAALLERERTGKGTTVDVSLLGSAILVLAPDVLAAHLHGSGCRACSARRIPNPHW